MSKYEVTLKITGKAFLVVDADDEDDAREKAIAECTIDDIEDWEPTGDADVEGDDEDEED